jgi:hypothetical protein
VRLTRAPLTVWSVLSRILIGVVGVAGAAVVGVPGIAEADPPPLPNINAFSSARPSDYSVMDGAWYAAELPHGQLRHRRIRDDLAEQRRPVGFCPQPRGQLHVRIETLLAVSATHRLWQC